MSTENPLIPIKKTIKQRKRREATTSNPLSITGKTDSREDPEIAATIAEALCVNRIAIQATETATKEGILG